LWGVLPSTNKIPENKPVDKLAVDQRPKGIRTTSYAATNMIALLKAAFEPEKERPIRSAALKDKAATRRSWQCSDKRHGELATVIIRSNSPE